VGNRSHPHSEAFDNNKTLPTHHMIEMQIMGVPIACARAMGSQV